MSAFSPSVTTVIVALAALTASFWFVAAFGERLTRIWRSATNPGRTAFVIACGLLCAFAGMKHPPLTSAVRPGLPDTVTSEEIARGYRVASASTNEAASYARPATAVRNERLFAHGAYRAWFPICLAPFAFPFGDDDVSDWVAFTDGKIRRTPRDSAGTLGLGGRPMLALPGESEFWHGTSPSGTYLITWKDFHPDADTNQTASLQLELFPNGDFIARSNNLAVTCRRIDPFDLDGDGLPNALDPFPRHYDGDCFGPPSDLPAGANTNAYYTVEIVAGDVNAEVVFSGDAPSNLPDPHFVARAGETNVVRLLIGKDYRVTASRPVECRTDEAEVVIEREGSCDHHIIWPVEILPGNGLHAFSMLVVPSCLGGIFSWTNSCCAVIEDDGVFSIDCNGCDCNGCLIEGYYGYEGYRLPAFAGECGCEWEPPEPPDIGFSVPRCVFLNNDNAREEEEDDLRAVAVSFDPIDSDPTGATLTLNCTSGGDHVRFWQDRYRNVSETLPKTYDAVGLTGAVVYVEGAVTSDTVGDVTFELVYEDGRGERLVFTNSLTVAEVVNVRLRSPVGCEDLPQEVVFEGQRHWAFDVTLGSRHDRHLCVPFQPLANPTNLVANDFSVEAEITLSPEEFLLEGVDAVWTKLSGTPESGVFTDIDGCRAKFSNPKVGGVYRFGVTYDGSPLSESILVLPLSGARIDAQIANDLARCETVIADIVSFAGRHRMSPTGFGIGKHLFWDDGHGDYLGRPDNADRPTVWFHNQVRDNDGKGAAATWFGYPTPIAKASNYLVGYAMRRLGASNFKMRACQLFGTWRWFNEELFNAAMDVVDNGTPYEVAASNAVRAVWLAKRKKRVIRQWPSPASADNHTSAQGPVDFNRQYRSPEFLEFTDDEDFNH